LIGKPIHGSRAAGVSTATVSYELRATSPRTSGSISQNQPSVDLEACLKIDTRLKVIHVSCYSGYRADERPVNFSLRGRKLVVEEIIDRWYGPHNSFFKVLADDKRVYLIKYDQDDDLWTLEKIMGLKLG
jgi:hypothetical protein